LDPWKLVDFVFDSYIIPVKKALAGG